MKTPNHQRWYAKTEAQSECVHIAHEFLHVLALSRRLATKISASEIRQKLVKSELLVGHDCCPHPTPKCLTQSKSALLVGHDCFSPDSPTPLSPMGSSGCAERLCPTLPRLEWTFLTCLAEGGRKKNSWENICHGEGSVPDGTFKTYECNKLTKEKKIVTLTWRSDDEVPLHV